MKMLIGAIGILVMLMALVLVLDNHVLVKAKHSPAYKEGDFDKT